MVAAALALMAIVAQDGTVLRAAPRDSAAQQTTLWQGDSLEIRGEDKDFLAVWDHRRERGGYVRATQVRAVSLKPEDAPALLAVVNFLRDAPGQEALGLAYGAAYVQAAPAKDIGASVLDAIGTMADRLARAASRPHAGLADQAMAAHTDGAAALGVKLLQVRSGEGMRYCYDGDAFRRVLAMPATPEQQAHAALTLTSPECIDPALSPVDRKAVDTWRAAVLDRVPLQFLPDYQRARVRLRQSGVWSSLAYEHRRANEAAGDSAGRALDAFAGVNRRQLTEADSAEYSDAALRVAAVRFAALPDSSTGKALRLVTEPGEPGQTCMSLMAVGNSQPAGSQTLLRRCTYGTVWTNSARANPQSTALVVGVQPQDGWRELWVYHKTATGWQVDVKPPSADSPDLGYVDFAGWAPGGGQFLAVDEARSAGRFHRYFEVVDIETLNVVKQSSRPEILPQFARWQDALWRQQTLSLR